MIVNHVSSYFSGKAKTWWKSTRSALSAEQSGRAELGSVPELDHGTIQ